jgi:hypothetical protein
MSPISWQRIVILGSAACALAACTLPQHNSRKNVRPDDLKRFEAAAQAAVECRAAASRDPRYSILVVHIPLDDIGKTTLPQMIDSHLATSDEVAALDAWTRDVGSCRDQLLQVTYTDLPSFGPSIEKAQDDDDSVFVMLAHHKLTWGQGVVRLKADRTALRASLIARTDELVAQTAAAQEEERNRRTTILSSVIRILP